MGHTKFGPDTGFGRMHLKFKNCNLLTGDDLKQAMMDKRNIPNEPSADVFRKWRDTFQKFFTGMKGICSTDVVEIRLERESNGLVAVRWAVRREIGEQLVFETQLQMLKEARKSNCDIVDLLQRVREATAFDEFLTNYPPDDDGLIKENRKQYLLGLLIPELRKLEVEPHVLQWWNALPCQKTADSEASEEFAPASCSSSQQPASVLSNISFDFMTDDIVIGDDDDDAVVCTSPAQSCRDPESVIPDVIEKDSANDKDISAADNDDIPMEQDVDKGPSVSKTFRDPVALVEQLSGRKRKRLPSAKMLQK